MEALKRIGRIWLQQRKRLSPLILVLAAVVIGSVIIDALPREVSIRYELGPDHALVTDARIVYLIDGEEVKGVRFHYDRGAPEQVPHQVELSPGRYVVQVSLRGPGLQRDLRRSLTVPADGVVRIALYDEAYAINSPTIRGELGLRDGRELGAR